MSKQTSEFPEVELGKVATFVNGFAFKTDTWSQFGRPIIRIQNLTGSSKKFNHYEGELPDKYLVVTGDILVSWSGSLDVFVWEGPEAGLNQHIFKVAEVSPDIDKSYLYFALRYRIQAIREKSHGSTMKHVTRADFLSSRIPVPPLEDQRAIALLLRNLQRSIASTDNVISAIRDLKRSLRLYLLAYGPVSIGDAESVVRSDTTLGRIPKQWGVLKFEELLAEPLRNGLSAREVTSRDGVRTLTLSAVTQNDFSIGNTKLTEADPGRVEELWLRHGDIFIERANTRELVGLAALYCGPDRFAIYPDLMIRARVNTERVLPKFAIEYLVSAFARRHFQSQARGAAGNMPKIGHGTVEKLPFPLPPLPDQESVAAILSAVDEKHSVEVRRRGRLQDLFEPLLRDLLSGARRCNIPGAA